MWNILNFSFCLVLFFAHLVFTVEITESSESEDELVFAHILFRHGDRNIIQSYDADPWKNENYWKEGLGQLTNIGRQQAYELGDYLRRRYSKLLINNGTYHKNIIYAQSSDVDRTLMSAAHVLAGMFPPKDYQIWNESLLWQAIPIHTLPQDQDPVIAAKKPCPKYNKAFNDYENSDEIQSIMKSNKTLYDYLENHVGKKVNSICNVKTIYQTLWVENLKNFTLPDWTSKVFYTNGDMNKLANFCFKMKTNTKTLARLKSGFFIREMFERFEQKINNLLTPNRNLWIYSGHDTTISNLFNSLGLFEKPHIPIYSSAVFWELHRVKGTYHVEIYYKYYRGDDPVPLEPISIPKCGQKCPLEKLYEIYKDIIPTADFDEECQLSDKTPSQFNQNTSNESNDSNQIFLSSILLLGALTFSLIKN